MNENERLEYAKAYADFLDKTELKKEVEKALSIAFFEGWKAGMKQATQLVKDEVEK